MLRRHGGERQGEVGAEEMNESEPSNQVSKFTRRCQNRRLDVSRDYCGVNVSNGHRTSGIETA